MLAAQGLAHARRVDARLAGGAGGAGLLIDDARALEQQAGHRQAARPASSSTRVPSSNWKLKPAPMLCMRQNM